MQQQQMLMSKKQWHNELLNSGATAPLVFLLFCNNLGHSFSLHEVGLVAAGAMRKEGITPDPLQMNTPPKQPVAHRPPAPAWPMSCNLLLLAQFLERLSLAHLKGVFTPFLVQNVGIQPEVANTCLQLLIQVGFFAPIVGAVLADAKYGKYG